MKDFADDEHIINPVSYSIAVTSQLIVRAFDRRIDTAFDYSSVDAFLAKKMRKAAIRVTKLMRVADADASVAEAQVRMKMPEFAIFREKRMRAGVLNVGRTLLRLKDQVSHGQFTAWVEGECHLAIRPAERAMRAAAMVDKNDKLSYLPIDGLLALASRAAEPVRDDIYRRINDGERPSAADIRWELEQAKRDKDLGNPTAEQRSAPPPKKSNQTEARIARQATLRALSEYEPEQASQGWPEDDRTLLDDDCAE